MPFTTLKKLLDTITKWFENEIPAIRVSSNDSKGRKWICKSLGYSGKFKLEDLKKITDRQNLNSLYVSRFKNDNVQSRKGISALKIEISALYSFQKCFTQRFKGRMHFYRDDLSQKGKRNMTAVGQAYGPFEELKKNLSA